MSTDWGGNCEITGNAPQKGKKMSDKMYGYFGLFRMWVYLGLLAVGCFLVVTGL